MLYLKLNTFLMEFVSFFFAIYTANNIFPFFYILFSCVNGNIVKKKKVAKFIINYNFFFLVM